MTGETHIARLRCRAASYRKIAGTRQSAEAKAIYLKWAAHLEREAEKVGEA